MTPEVGSTANSYEILSKLAEGGMAEIFLARVVSGADVRRHVVLKRVSRERALDMQYVRMFLDEARLAAQLQHPNIAQVFDIGKLGTSYFFTMEYVHGVTVMQLLQRGEERTVSLPIAAVLSIVVGAAAGLHHAHQRTGHDGRPLGVVHRDVSPSNLMVSFEGHVKVVDFGVAKAIGMPETQAGAIKGKVAYLSPEQCRQQKVDCRSDLFSLGIVMWEMLTGERLFLRDSPFESMAAIATEPATPPSKWRKDLPTAIENTVLRLLAIEPGDRYQTGAQVIEAIEAAAQLTKIPLSPVTLARLLRELFGTQPEPWRLVEREVVTVTSQPIPADLEDDVDPVHETIDAKLTSQFSTVTPMPQFETTDLNEEDPPTRQLSILPTALSARETRRVPTLADAPYDMSDELPTSRDHQKPKLPLEPVEPVVNPLLGAIPETETIVNPARAEELQTLVRPNRASAPPPVSTLAGQGPPISLDPRTIKGSGPYVPPPGSGPRPLILPVLPPLAPRPPPQTVPLRWWIFGGALLGVALTAVVVVAVRGSDEPEAVAAVVDAGVRISVDAPRPIDAAVVDAFVEPEDAPIDAPETDELSELAAMDDVPAPKPSPPRKLRTKAELNYAYASKRYKDVILACRELGPDGERANVCTLAACRSRNAVAQDWYRNVTPNARASIVGMCISYGHKIKDICATDLLACRQ